MFSSAARCRCRDHRRTVAVYRDDSVERNADEDVTDRIGVRLFLPLAPLDCPPEDGLHARHHQFGPVSDPAPDVRVVLGGGDHVASRRGPLGSLKTAHDAREERAQISGQSPCVWGRWQPSAVDLVYDVVDESNPRGPPPINSIAADPTRAATASNVTCA